MTSDNELFKTKKVIKLCKDLVDGVISQEDCHKELAYIIIVEMFDSLKYIPLPEMPDILKEYYSLPLEQKEKISRKFWDQKEIVKYKEKQNDVKLRNDSTINTLTNLLEWLPEEDKENIEKVKDRMEKIKKEIANEG